MRLEKSMITPDDWYNYGEKLKEKLKTPKKFKMESKFVHKRSEGLRGKRGTK